MPGRRQTILHRFTGGWATDFGTYLDVAPTSAGVVEIPFLLDAQNLEYELDGALHKIGGMTKYNSTALASGADITGIYDYWRYAGGASATQTIVCHAGTGLYNLSSGSATPITGATLLTAGAIPDYSTFNDLLIYTSNSNVPRSWDGTTDQALAGSPPNFSFSEPHKNRLFAAGVPTSTSTLYASVAEDPTDWSGYGSVKIEVSPDDGDAILAIKSFRGELWIFKGPHQGSIWRLQGSAPESSDPFRLVPFAIGIGAVAQRMVFQIGNDLGFVNNDGSVLSLADTSAVAGQYQMSALSLPINSWLRDKVVASRLPYAVAAVHTGKGKAFFTLTYGSGTTNNIMLEMDYRFSPPRWSQLPAFSDVVCLASVNDPAANNRPTIMAGGGDGFARRFAQNARSIDGTTAYTYRWKTPTINYGDPFLVKQHGEFAVSVVPRGPYPVEFGWKNDGNPFQTYDVDQHGGDVLGPTTSGHPFLLNHSYLASGGGVDEVFDAPEGGEFRRIQYRAINGELNQDAEIHGFAARLTSSGISVEM